MAFDTRLQALDKIEQLDAECAQPTTQLDDIEAAKAAFDLANQSLMLAQRTCKLLLGESSIEAGVSQLQEEVLVIV